jgi:hypothetical protein
MPAWDNVSLPPPPSLVPPKADFSTLGEIIPAYRQAQQQKRQVDIQNVAKDLPDNPTPEDFQKIGNRLFRLGDYTGASQMYQALYAQQDYNQPSGQPNPLGMNAPAGAPSGQPTVADTARPFVQQQPVAGPVQDPNLRPDEQISPAQVASANQPQAVPPQTGPAVPGVGPGSPPDPNSPIVPRPVATVPGQMIRPQPATPQPQQLAPNAQVAQASQAARANPSAVDAMLPPQFRGNPMGFVNDQFTKGNAYDDAATRQEHIRGVGSGAALRSKAQQFYATGNKVLDALAPTPEQRNAAASGQPSPLGYEGAKAQQVADIAARQHEEQKTSDMLDTLTQKGIAAKEQSAKLNAVDTLGQKVGYGVIPKIQSYLGAHGIDTAGLSDIQAYERAIDFLAPQLRPEGSGRLMAAELTSFKNALGGLMTTPAGRKISVQNLKLISDFDQKVGAISSDTSLTPSQRTAKIYALEAPRLQTSLLPVGAIRTGSGNIKYRFNGGNPNDQASWSPTSTAQQVQRFRQGGSP